MPALLGFAVTAAFPVLITMERRPPSAALVLIPALFRVFARRGEGRPLR